jgi:preprotein translocase, SecE subunit, bacterial
MKFRDWFSIKGIMRERRRVSWISKKELVKNSIVVILFCVVMGAFFFTSDAIIAFILNLLGLR